MPEHPERMREGLGEGFEATKINYILRSLFFDEDALDRVSWWTTALTDPRAAVRYQYTRTLVASALERLLTVILNDTVLWNRLKTLMLRMKANAEREEEDEE
jgi:hypothetical protein